MTTRVLLAGILIGVVLALVVGAASSHQGDYQIAVTSGRDGSYVIARLDCGSGEVVAVRKGETEIFPNPTQCIVAGKRQ